MKKTFFLISLICLTSATVSAKSGASYWLLSKVPILDALELKHYRLKNGLQVVIVEDDTRPVVTGQIYYRVGAADEPAKRQGLAHLVEHVLHDQKFLEELNLQGGRHSNASTSRDGTRYYVTIPNYLLPQVLVQFAQDMVTFEVTEDAFEIEKEVVLAEATNNYNSAQQILYHKMYGEIFEGHPYQYALYGTHRDSIKGFTIAEAKQFHGRYYVPNNACLIIVGDVVTSDVMADVVRVFGEIPSGNVVARKTPFEPVFDLTNRDSVVHGTRVVEPSVWSVWPLPPARHTDRMALEFMAKFFFAGSNSPVSRVLRDAHLVTSSRYAISLYRDAGWIFHKADLVSGAYQSEVTNVLQKTIHSVVDSVSDERLHIIRNLARKDLYAIVTHQSSLAGVIGYSFIHANDPTYRIRWMQNLNQVSKADIQRVTQKYLIDQPMRQFVMAKYKKTTSFWGKVMILVVVVLLVLGLIFIPHYKKRHLLKVSGLVFFTFVSHAQADIPNHKIYYQHDPRVPQTELSLVYATGGRQQEPVDKKGLLFVLQRLVQDRIRQTIGPHFDRLGAQVFFTASDLDATVKIRVFSENLTETLKLVQEFLETLQFEERALAQSRSVVMNTFERSIEGRQWVSVFRDYLFAHAENRRIATRQGIERVTVSDVNAYVQKTLQAKVLYFKVISDLRFQEIQEQVSVLVSDRLQTGFSAHPKPQREHISFQRFVIVPAPFATVTQCYGLSNAVSQDHKLWFAQSLMVDALSQYWFYKLREQNGWCYTAQVNLETRFAPPVIKFYANPPREHTYNLIREMHRMILGFEDDPDFWVFWKKSKPRLKQAYALKYDLGAILNQQIEFDRDGILPLSVAEYEKRIDSATETDIRYLSQLLFDPTQYETGGLIMYVSGEEAPLRKVLGKFIPRRNIEVFDSETLTEEVRY